MRSYRLLVRRRFQCDLGNCRQSVAFVVSSWLGLDTGDYSAIEEVRSMMRDAADESQDSKPLQDVRVDELTPKR